jgi:hypothetical protein
MRNEDRGHAQGVELEPTTACAADEPAPTPAMDDEAVALASIPDRGRTTGEASTRSSGGPERPESDEHPGPVTDGELAAITPPTGAAG